MLAVMRALYPLMRVAVLSLGLLLAVPSVARADKDDDKKEKTARRGGDKRPERRLWSAFMPRR